MDVMECMKEIKESMVYDTKIDIRLLKTKLSIEIIANMEPNISKYEEYLLVAKAMEGFIVIPGYYEHCSPNEDYLDIDTDCLDDVVLVLTKNELISKLQTSYEKAIKTLNTL